MDNLAFWALMAGLSVLAILTLMHESKRLTGLLAVLLLVIAGGGYALYGQPDALNFNNRMAEQHQTADAEQGNTRADITVMLMSLQQRLKQQPDDLEGWKMLGRSMMALDRYTEASAAYLRALKLDSDNNDLKLKVVDAQLMSRSGRAEQQSTQLLEDVLQQEPDNTTALWLGGMLANKNANHEQAKAYWQTLVPLLHDDPESQQEVRKLLARLEQKKTQPATLTQVPDQAENPQASRSVLSTNLEAPQSIDVTVTLDPTLQERVTPEDTVFIYVRAMQGPPMPLAAQRIRVADLPYRVVLDDSMAMMPSLVMSGFDRFRVGARISQSGTPKAKAGDLFSEQLNVILGDKVEIIINNIY